MISNTDKRWYNLAVRVAEESLCYDRHGCVIVKSGTLLSIATNRNGSHPVSKKYLKRDIHAEQRAIQKTFSAVGATLYTARIHMFSPIGKPCGMCEELIIKAGIKRVIYCDGENLVEWKTKKSIKL
jgi:deoxycytidylate deaminase